MITRWPKEIPIPERVGKGTLRNQNGSPCCAEGHFRETVHYLESKKPLYTELWRAFQAKYRQAHRALTGRDGPSVTFLNDTLPNDRQRRLVYLTAWALLGYTVGMPKEAIQLAKQVVFEFYLLGQAA